MSIKQHSIAPSSQFEQVFITIYSFISVDRDPFHVLDGHSPVPESGLCHARRSSLQEAHHTVDTLLRHTDRILPLWK